jgi:hypothetical protein
LEWRAAWIVGLGVWAVVGAGCRDPVEVVDEMCPEAQVTLCSDPTAKAAAQEGGSDVSARSTPALENAAARQALAASLVELNTALGAGNITKSRNALGESRRALATAQTQLSTFAGDAADLGAIELLLDHVASLIGS